MNAIFFVLRTGCQWNALRGAGICSSTSAHRQPQGICMDKGYDHAFVRDIVAEYSLTAHIRSRGEEAKAKRRRG